MTISGDEAAVKAHIAGAVSGDSLQLGGDEILLHDAVGVVEILQYAQLKAALLLLVGDRLAAYENVEALAGDGLAQGLLGLLTAQVGQQVVDDKLGVRGLVTHMEFHSRAVCQRHHAVKLQGHRHPLILADAAVVMGLEIGHLRLFIEGAGLQVKAGSIGVGGGDVGPLGEGLAADNSQHDALAAVVAVDLIASLQRHVGHIFHEALLLGKLDAVLHALTLRLAAVEEQLIVLAILVHFLAFRLVQTVIAVLGGVEQLLAQFLFAHSLFLLL